MFTGSKMVRKFIVAAFAIATFATFGVTSALGANQTGLVNVNVAGNTIQLPVALAANLCDIEVNVLVAELREDGTTTCDAFAGATATAVEPGGGGGHTNQTGLVNVNIEDNVVQVPIAVALNVCDVDINVLSLIFNADPNDTVCTADARSRARG